MNFIVNLLILLPAQIASYFSWAGPLIMRVIVGYVFMLTGWGKLNNLPQMIRELYRMGHPVSENPHPFRIGRRMLRRRHADPWPVHQDPGGDAGGGHDCRRQGRRNGTMSI